MEAGSNLTKPVTDPVLRLTWPEKRTLHYGVRIIFEEENASNEVKYEIQVTRLTPDTDGTPRFGLRRTSEVFVNDMLPDLLADQLAYEAGKVFYPLLIRVDRHGGFESVCNHEDLLQRWPAVKERILSRFEGELTDLYLARMEKQLASPDRVQTALARNDWFLQAFFKPIYRSYAGIASEPSLFSFPLLKSYDLLGYQTQEQLSNLPNHFGAPEVRHTGTLLTADTALPPGTPAKGFYEARYILHPREHHIIALTADCTLQEAEKVKVGVRINLIPEAGQDFDSDFGAGQAAGSSGTNLVMIDGPRKKTFWERLFD